MHQSEKKNDSLPMICDVFSPFLSLSRILVRIYKIFIDASKAHKKYLKNKKSEEKKSTHKTKKSFKKKLGWFQVGTGMEKRRHKWNENRTAG